MTTTQKSTRCPTAPDLRKFSLTTTVKRQSAFTVSGLIVVGIIIGIFFFACGRNVMECYRGLDQFYKLVHVKNGDLDSKIEKVNKILHMENDLYYPWIHDWEKDDEKFIITKATERIEKQLSHFYSVVVVGHSGNGKSSIIRHIALKLRNEKNMEIIPFVNKPSDIFQFHCESRNQVFVIDDFCGIDVINPHIVHIWSRRIDEILKLMNKQHSSVRFLFSVGHDIYDDNIFQPLESLKKYVVNLSDFILTEIEKKEMINKYIPVEMQSQYNMYKKTEGYNKDYYPVLCKIAEGKKAEQIMNVFTNLHDSIEKEISVIHKEKSLQFYIILYCALFNDNFNAQILDGAFSSNHEQTAFYEICVEFHYGLYKESGGIRLKEFIKGLEFGYVRQTEDSIYFIHRKVYQIAAIVYGQTFVDCFIKLASHTFIAEHYRFESINPEITGDFIWIKDDDTENSYFDRLIKDLERGITYSSFHNSQLHNTSYRKRFCAYCYNKKQKVIALLYNLKNMNHSQLRNECEENEHTFDDETFDYEDYIDFEKQVHFSSHTMRKPILESAWEGYADIVQLLIDMELDVDQTDRFGRTALIVASHLGKTEVVNILLKNKANYSMLDKKSQSALLAASRKGHNEIVKLLLEKNANTSVLDSDGLTPFLAACEGGHTAVTELLFKKAVDIFVCDNMGQSSLFFACLYDCKDVVDYLITQTSDTLLNRCNKKGMSPLSNSCMKGNINIVTLLLEANANFEICDSNGRTPLFIACEEGHTEVVDILVKKGADITTCDWQKNTLLSIACKNGNFETVKTLLELNPSLINKTSENSRSPLFIASEKGHYDIVNTLLSKNADIEQQDNKERTPLYVACRSGKLKVAQLLHSWGAKINVCNTWGGSPLFTACREGHLNIVKFLIDKNASFEADKNKTTPLLVSCEEGYTEIAKILIAKDAGINTCNDEKKYPLHSAVFGGHTDIVKALLDNAADKSVKDSEDHTPLDIAKIRGFSNIEKILGKKKHEKGKPS